MDKNLLVQSILSIPKTLYFNFRYLPFKQARKLPILIHYRTKVFRGKKGNIVLDDSCTRFMVKLGFNENPMSRSNRNSILWFDKGIIEFKGKAVVGKGFSLRSEGQITIGDNFYSQQNSTLWCKNKISLGNNILFGWNVFLRDHDGHYILHMNSLKAEEKPITIGDHVWICSDVSILKGVKVGCDSIVAFRSLVTKAFTESNIMIGGQPAKIIQEDVNWSRYGVISKQGKL